MIGFIGVGNMGGAILKGVLSTGTIHATDVVFTRLDTRAGKDLAVALGTTFVPSATEVVQAVGAGIVILAVKPATILPILHDIRDAAAQHGTTIVSVAAGITLETLQKHLHPDQPIVRAMPNVPAQIKLGITGLCPNSNVSDERFAHVNDLFNSVGSTLVLPEKNFSAFTAVAGSSPAWTFQYIDALSRGALADGMSKNDALRAAAGAVLGAAQLALDALDRGQRPQALIDTVTSPGGTTIAGLIAAEREGFTNATIAAVQACIARDKELM